ncbi:dephospho-CoA kinase [Marinobacterium sediminicola]|uniref:Dephospho-CoA kinase n=1 Tax=Marinobacterium sediminicola TaxID=518898 RepID=A0ABY1S407_9GAMM|nr:dephospho-CoA kinase [Marinobacterium sediminicola]ULG68237.1 dephospho-CoA kinase [Marinobacterium sediminicola]SMR77793.1 dephospho-CoA kinase [Marinobacterium sediminicola]
MLVAGLTGGIGSGKSAASACFTALGVPVIDADLVARQVVEPGSEALIKIAAHFGQDVIKTDGNLDRAALRRIVFDKERERNWLEALLHPLIRESILDTLEQFDADGHAYAVLASPLLLETDQHLLVSKVIVVDVPESLQIERTMQRDGIEEPQVRQILAAQMNRDERLSHADFILDNSGNEEALADAVSALHPQLLTLAAEEDAQDE